MECTAQACIEQKQMVQDNSNSRILRIIKIMRMLKIVRLLKSVKAVEWVGPIRRPKLTCWPLKSQPVKSPRNSATNTLLLPDNCKTPQNVGSNLCLCLCLWCLCLCLCVCVCACCYAVGVCLCVCVRVCVYEGRREGGNGGGTDGGREGA